MSEELKFQMYARLQQNLPRMYEEARKAADEIGIPPELRGKFGLTGAISGCPAPLREDIVHASEEAANEVIPLAGLVEQIRAIVKEVYGDEYDAAPVNTCEAALWLAFDVLVSPPMQGRGDNYRSRYLVPYEKHLHHHGSYGRPYPPKYKDLFADRGCTAGELGFYGKRQPNVDAVIVPLVGARYEVHGIKQWPVPMLVDVDPEESAKRFRRVAERHSQLLAAVSSLGYDTPGYGYGTKDADGTPVLLKRLGELAAEFDIPYIVDNAWGLPFVGVDPRKIGADVIVYSMDKASGAATSGLLIGREEVMVAIRRALGMHGERWGTGASYGKAAYVTFDPGKEALVTQLRALRVLKDHPEVLTEPVDRLYDLVLEELEELPDKLRKHLLVSKSYNSGTVEINYERTWTGDEPGFPIFSIEDMYAGSHALQTGLKHMGVIPTIAYDGNIFISPGMGTCDEKGRIIEDRMRYALKALVRLMKIVGRYSGYFD